MMFAMGSTYGQAYRAQDMESVGFRAWDMENVGSDFRSLLKGLLSTLGNSLVTTMMAITHLRISKDWGALGNMETMGTVQKV